MNGIVAGWGRLREDSPASYTLQQVQLPIISNRNQFCIRQISDDRLQFCAGFIQGGKDTCQGDR
jgi:trypsin